MLFARFGLALFGLFSNYIWTLDVVCRNEFHKLGKDLESAKGRDMDRYHNILMQLKESYSQCGMVCFKVFLWYLFCGSFHFYVQINFTKAS